MLKNPPKNYLTFLLNSVLLGPLKSLVAYHYHRGLRCAEVNEAVRVDLVNSSRIFEDEYCKDKHCAGIQKNDSGGKNPTAGRVLCRRGQLYYLRKTLYRQHMN